MSDYVATPADEKFCWVVLFEKDGKLYLYTNRTTGYMAARIGESHAKNGYWPYGIWVAMNGEMHKVDLVFQNG